jgi:hypothetical protein
LLQQDPDETIISDTELSFDDKQSMANIRSYILSEDNRDLNQINSYLSGNMYKYYDLSYPTSSQLQKRFEYVWGITSNNHNYISEVKKIGERRYQVSGTYEYFGLKSQEDKTVNTNLIFETDENNKIISIDNFK